MKKVLVIGQDGMLGGELYERLCKKNNEYEVYKKESLFGFPSCSYFLICKTCEITIFIG